MGGLLHCLLPSKLHHFHCRCRTFKEIASTEGSKSMEKKKGLIQKLVVGSRNNETGYIMRALQVQCVPQATCPCPAILKAPSWSPS